MQLQVFPGIIYLFICWKQFEPLEVQAVLQLVQDPSETIVNNRIIKKKK